MTFTFTSMYAQIPEIARSYLTGTAAKTQFWPDFANSAASIDGAQIHVLRSNAKDPTCEFRSQAL